MLILVAPLRTSDGILVAFLDQNQTLINEDVRSIANLMDLFEEGNTKSLNKNIPSTPIVVESRTIAPRISHLYTASSIVGCCNIAIIASCRPANKY